MKTNIEIKVLVCHGAWCDGESLHEWLFRGAGKEFVICSPTLYGHGDRSECLDNVSLDLYVKEMRTHLRAMGPSHLVGHSLGGLIMQKVAEFEPDLVLSLTLLGSTPPKGIRVPFNWRFSKPRYWRALALGKSFEVGPAEKEHFFPDLPPGVTLCRESGRVCREVLRGYPVGQLSVPTLVIAGRFDAFFPPSVEDAIAKLYTWLDRAIIYDCGHMFHFSSRKEEIRDGILAFIRSSDDG